TRPRGRPPPPAGPPSATAPPPRPRRCGGARVMRSFPVVRRASARREVDDLFARIDETLGGGPVTGHPVTAAELRATRLSVAMRGYASKGGGRSPERRFARA